MSSALSTITAAVVDVILNLAVRFGLHVLFQQVAKVRLGPLSLDVQHAANLDPVPLALFAAAIALFRFRLDVAPTPLGARGAGAVWHAVMA